MKIATLKQLRIEFWRDHPEFRRVPSFDQDEYCTDIRMAWCDFVEYHARNNTINESLAFHATLK